MPDLVLTAQQQSHERHFRAVKHFNRLVCVDPARLVLETCRTRHRGR